MTAFPDLKIPGFLLDVDQINRMIADAVEVQEEAGPEPCLTQFIKDALALRATHGVEKSETATALQLAKAFSANVRETFTYEEFEQAIHRNATEENQDVCHTHDFCDANDLMQAAFEFVMGRTPNGDDETDATLWSDAWAIAKAANFRI